jgi:dienelactone hydrolase
MTDLDALRRDIAQFLGVPPRSVVPAPQVAEVTQQDGYTRRLLTFESMGEAVPAFLFEPADVAPKRAVVVLHQHNSEWAIGKSEVAGLVGDPLQAFGPALARAGALVLAPDAVGFESRQGPLGHGGTLPPLRHKPHGSADGWLQYYNHAMHRLARGELLISRVLADAMNALTLLSDLAPAAALGVLGHSYGGNTALFTAALDTRVAFACVSGAACSFRYKLAHGIGLEMSLAVPGIAQRFDFDDLMRCVAPRQLFVVSADDDRFSADAEELVERARPAFEAAGAPTHLRQLRVHGEHALDRPRFDSIVGYVAAPLVPKS